MRPYPLVDEIIRPVLRVGMPRAEADCPRGDLKHPARRGEPGLRGAICAAPGATFQVTAKQVCTKGYAQKVRKVTKATKQQVYALYGAKKKGVCCEVDHLILLELGGSNEVTNLWPQPYKANPGAYEKDILENFLHRAVCGGAMPLEEAERKIATDWYKAYQEMKGNTP